MFLSLLVMKFRMEANFAKLSERALQTRHSMLNLVVFVEGGNRNKIVVLVVQGTTMKV